MNVATKGSFLSVLWTEIEIAAYWNIILLVLRCLMKNTRKQLFDFYAIYTIGLERGLSSNYLNIYNAAGVGRRHVKNVRNIVKKYKHSGIWWLYLVSPWKMHSNKYKHAWYWFSKLWNSLGRFIILREQKHFAR